MCAFNIGLVAKQMRACELLNVQRDGAPSSECVRLVSRYKIKLVVD